MELNKGHRVARCSACGRRIDLERFASTVPGGRRRPHRGAVCVFCRLRSLLPDVRHVGEPPPGPGHPGGTDKALLTAAQARQRYGLPVELLYAATALGVIHPIRFGRPTGRRRRVPS